MSRTESLEGILESAVSAEIGGLSHKLDYWGLKSPESGTVWENKDSLTLQECLAMIDPEGEELNNSETLATLYGMGWEFVWGEKPPEIVKSLRNDVLDRAKLGFDLNELEKLWLQLMVVDTDMF